MSSTHPISRTTEWDDLQIKYGNYQPLEPEVKEEEHSLRAQELIASLDPLANKSLKQLSKLEGDVEDDTLEMYRAKRLAELREKQRRAKFGEIVPISGVDYVQQVTEASADGQVVLCHLYKDSVPKCVLLNHCLKELARRHPELKVCCGVSDLVVPNFKDSNLPTVLVYKNRECIHQILDLILFGGFKATSPDSVEWVLAKRFKLFDTDLTENPLTALEDRSASKQRRKGTTLQYNRQNFNTDESSSSDEEEKYAHLRNVNPKDRGYGDTGVEEVMNTIRKI